ncbi:hypothetical protein J437_LFUL012057 [Ladona fulva]|uniref:Coiled-coil domain-containing protein 39 n=1 Tax=Ladona fulva TaxID=123851 RepID=A0A8K0KGS3_LADFU|nr:hypothetical protein J437_LFUL012057 [Ladona fulva]
MSSGRGNKNPGIQNKIKESMETKLENVMKQIGWTDGYHVPLLNEENTQLSNKIEEMLKEKAHCLMQSDDLANSVNNVEKTLKDIMFHYQHNQGLIYACKTYKETEEHMMKLSICNEKIAKKEISKYTVTQNEINSRNEELEAEIRRLKEIINEIEKSALLDHGTILLWEEEIVNQEELSQEQSLLLEKLQNETRNKQQKLEKLSYDIKSQEVALEHARNTFRKIHGNRQFLIKKWEGCVSFVGKRDEEIMILRNEIDGLLQNFSQQRETLQDELSFMSGLERNNRETEIKTKCFDREAAVLLGMRNKSKEKVEEIENEISTVSRSLANTGKLLQQERCLCKFIAKGNSDMNSSIEKLDRVIDSLKDRLKDVYSHHESANERRAQLEEILMAEETNVTEVENELKNVQYNIFVNQSHLGRLKNKELSLSTLISGIESSIKLLTNEKVGISKKVLQKFQMVYNLDYLIEKQESRISHMLGCQKSSKQEELVKKLNDLEKAVVSKNKEYKFLSLQKSKLES